GANSSLGSDIAVTRVNRTGNVATLNVANTTTLAVGDLVIVNVAAPNTSFNNGGAPVALTSVTATQIKYANTGANVGNTNVSSSKINLVGGTPTAGSTVKKRKTGLLTVDGAGGACAALSCIVSKTLPDTVVADPGGTTGAGTQPAN